MGAVFVNEHERLVRVAYLLTGSSAVAEDLVQDAFVRLHLGTGTGSDSRPRTCVSRS